MLSQVPSMTGAAAIPLTAEDGGYNVTTAGQTDADEGELGVRGINYNCAGKDDDCGNFKACCGPASCKCSGKVSENCIGTGCFEKGKGGGR